jgi:hypothetical protein
MNDTGAPTLTMLTQNSTALGGDLPPCIAQRFAQSLRSS